jgi:hypothetical protein
MENQIQISNSENFYLQKREEIQNEINLPTKTFLQKSYDFKKIKEIKSDPNFIFLVSGWIAQTSILMEIKNPIDSFTKQDIINMLDGYWSSFTLEEMIKAFELERFGQYKETTEHFQLFNASYIAKVFKKYQNWKHDKKIELNISNQNTDMENALTQEQKFEIMSNAINEKYLHYVNTKQVSEPYTHIFTELIERGLIKMPTSKTPKLTHYFFDKITQAKEELKIELQSKTEPDKIKRKNIQVVLNSILENNPNDSAKLKIEIRAKKLVLIDFFNKYLQLNSEKIV